MVKHAKLLRELSHTKEEFQKKYYNTEATCSNCRRWFNIWVMKEVLRVDALLNETCYNCGCNNTLK